MKTAEQLLRELDEATEEGRSVLRGLHGKLQETKTFYKVEHKRAEEILREETAKSIAKVADQVQSYLVAQVDAVVAEFRQRLLGSSDT